MGKGIDPAIWGPHAWNWLHRVASRWRMSGCRDNKVFAKAVGGWVHMLPCNTCRESFCEFYRILRPEALACDSIEQWAYDLHNHVNVKLHQAGKPGKWPPPTFPHVQRRGRTPRDIDPVWQMLLIFAGHYDNTGVANRTRVHRNYVGSLVELYAALGDFDASDRLAMLEARLHGRFTAEDFTGWVIECLS